MDLIWFEVYIGWPIAQPIRYDLRLVGRLDCHLAASGARLSSAIISAATPPNSQCGTGLIMIV